MLRLWQNTTAYLDGYNWVCSDVCKKSKRKCKVPQFSVHQGNWFAGSRLSIAEMRLTFFRCFAKLEIFHGKHGKFCNHATSVSWFWKCREVSVQMAYGSTDRWTAKFGKRKNHRGNRRDETSAFLSSNLSFAQEPQSSLIGGAPTAVWGSRL